jgi:serine/threonine protein phosphatase PrpC
MDLSKSIEMASATHTGMVRAHNEDSIGTDAAVGLAVLADGMGGYNAGRSRKRHRGGLDQQGDTRDRAAHTAVRDGQ